MLPIYIGTVQSILGTTEIIIQEDLLNNLLMKRGAETSSTVTPDTITTAWTTKTKGPGKNI
jgi:hypothetical protein